MNSWGAITAWVALALVGYVYVGYPILIGLLARLMPKPVRPQPIEPSVTLLISAFNEEAVIGDKLRNALALDYPNQKLEIIVVSDASTDATDSLVQSFSPERVRLIRMPERRGKTAGLNAAMEVAQGDVVVFSDANIMYRTDAIRWLVRSFADPEVGCVTGDSRYIDQPESAAHEQENAYWGYERYIRTRESEMGSTVGGDGAIFAIRRLLYSPLQSWMINDLVVPLQIVAKGYRAVFEPMAVGIEPSAGDFKREFRRKRRIVNRSWRGVMSVGAVLNPFSTGIFAWQVWSHKVLRWLVLPFVVVAAVGCTTAYPLGWVYQIGTWGFVASLALAALGAWAPFSLGPVTRFAQGMFYFYLVNLAALLGVWRALTGRVEAVWVPERG